MAIVRLADVVTHPEIERIAAALAARPAADHVPRPGDPLPRRAAVALVLRVEHGGLALLFVKRAEYAGDPWSGQVAFPGGRHEPEDGTLWDTATRETREETALDLTRDGRLLGRLDDLHPRSQVLPSIVVRPFVAVAAPSEPLALSPELSSAFWVPVDRLRDAEARVISVVRPRGEEMRVPSFVHDGHTIWGMTFRILEDFLARI
jgi:8-oxo-dGTP pyrophosphatase MutT (NUDIX family)